MKKTDDNSSVIGNMTELEPTKTEKPSSRRIPRPTLRRRLSDPFSDGDHDNFPGLDSAFVSNDDVEATPKMSSSSKKRRPQHEDNNRSFSSSERDTSPFMLDRSVCSQASSVPNSSLDMSIGARASLTEHLRHIAKHGLDGQKVVQESTARHDGDEEWDRLMDGNASVASWSTTHTNDTTTGLGVVSYIAPVYTVQPDGNESIEIVTDLNASDYFNSSRVQCLVTPEKNRNLTNGVTLRANNNERHPRFPSFEEASQPSSDCNTGVSDQSSLQSSMNYMYKAAMGFVSAQQQQQSQPDTSFASYTGSFAQIASFDEDFPSSSPDTSFQQAESCRKRAGDNADIRDLIPPIVRTSSSKYRDSSSTPRRSSPRRKSFFTPKRGSPGWLKRSESNEKENALPNLGSLALSPIAAKAGSEAGRLLRESGIPTGDGTPFLFSESPIKKCGTPPSRFARSGSSNSLYHHGSPAASSRAPSTVSEHFVADINFSTGSKRKGNNDSSCSRADDSSNCPRASKEEDVYSNVRRKNCSVVPRRVFLSKKDNAPQTTDDSFSIPSAGVGTTSSTTTQEEDDLPIDTSRRSLLDSFEAAFRNEPLPTENKS